MQQDQLAIGGTIGTDGRHGRWILVLVLDLVVVIVAVVVVAVVVIVVVAINGNGLRVTISKQRAMGKDLIC